MSKWWILRLVWLALGLLTGVIAFLPESAKIVTGIIALLFILATLLLDDKSDFLAMVLMIGDPPYGAMLVTMAADQGNIRIAGGYSFDELVPEVAIWIAVSFIASALLYLATLASFDRCLGRIRG